MRLYLVSGIVREIVLAVERKERKKKERKKKKEKEKENEKENKISSFYAFSVLFCLVVSILSLVIGLILAITGYGEASYICAAIFGVSFTAFLLGSWWKTTSIASKADWSDWGWL